MDDKNPQETFLILDGNALIHRAFHAMPPFTTKDGIPTGAVYGFFSMLLKLISDLRPAYIAVTFDRPKPTFRQALFTGYQAQRPKMEDTLVTQMKIVHELLEESKIPIFEVDGYEADDVIGTLSLQAQNSSVRKAQDKAQNLRTIIVSGDRDLLQLVNDKTLILMPIIGITKMKLYGEKEVEEKYGLSPKQIIDYKALAGDASDNYPGVHGIGPKTAIELVKRYGSVEELYKKINEIEKENRKTALKLTEGQEPAMLAKQLATVLCDVPLHFSIVNCDFKHLDRAKLTEAFTKYEIKSLVKRLQEIFIDNPVQDKNEEKKHKISKNPQQLDLLS